MSKLLIVFEYSNSRDLNLPTQCRDPYFKKGWGRCFVVSYWAVSHMEGLRNKNKGPVGGKGRM